jgi:hypothetical protein
MIAQARRKRENVCGHVVGSLDMHLQRQRLVIVHTPKFEYRFSWEISVPIGEQATAIPISDKLYDHIFRFSGYLLGPSSAGERLNQFPRNC